MTQKTAVFHGRLKKEKGKLIFEQNAKKEQYHAFLEGLQEGQCVDAFFDANKDDGTLAQLAKVHACIREIAMETGMSFEEAKLEVKRAAGLCVKKEYSGDLYMVCKSFSKCSKEELALVIEAIVQLGDTLNINFR